LAPEDVVLDPEDELEDEELLDAAAVPDVELSPLDSFFAAEPLDAPPADAPARLSVR
jgi:hypothetical protein